MRPYLINFFGCSFVIYLSFYYLCIFFECWLLASASQFYQCVLILIVSISLLMSSFFSIFFFLNIYQIYYKSQMSLELTINLDFLESIDPPTTWPPNEDQLIIQIQNKFLSQCQKFISNERMLYKCSKSIENRLRIILNNAERIQQNLATQKEKFNSINAQLKRYRDHDQILKQRQKILKMLCQLIKMQDIRKDLLISQQKKDNNYQVQKASILINEDEYLLKLSKLSKIIQQSNQLTNLYNQFPLIKDIINQLENIFNLSVNLIIKKFMTPKMVELCLNKYNQIFFSKNNISQTFTQAIIANRIQNMKISLNPMINNLNYATNIPDLYQSILKTWVQLINQQINLFSHSNHRSLIKTINNHLINEMIPKMQKNIFRIKQLVAVVRIRKSFYDYWNEIKKIQFLQQKTQSEKGQSIILNVLMKCEVVIESQLSEQSSFLQNSKYNIHTLISYIPIREHLEKVRTLYQYSLENQQIDWEVGFYNLFASRNPKNHPNNKSLIIFNLNIWYLYLKLIKDGKHKQQGQEIMKWTQQTFTSINIQETNKKYYESFEKILEIGGNISAFKNTLYAQISLLGHQQLRKIIADDIRRSYLNKYEEILNKIQKKPMNNEQVKAYCNSKKINLNKFGKYSHSICIYSKEALQELLIYN